MINKKTAKVWSDMAKEQMEKNWKIDVIIKAKVNTPIDLLDAVAKYIDKKITGYAKVTGNTCVAIDLDKIRKSITANSDALTVLGKNDLTIDSYINKTIVEMLRDNDFNVTDLMSEDKLIVDWSK
jgi:hypothetical protein